MGLACCTATVTVTYQPDLPSTGVKRSNGGEGRGEKAPAASGRNHYSTYHSHNCNHTSYVSCTVYVLYSTVHFNADSPQLGAAVLYILHYIIVIVYVSYFN